MRGGEPALAIQNGLRDDIRCNDTVVCNVINHVFNLFALTHLKSNLNLKS